MQERSVMPFVRALFHLAQERNVLDSVREDLDTLLKLILNTPDFKNFLINSSIPLDKQKNILTEISRNSQPLTKTFLLYMAEHKRLNWLKSFLKEFENFYLTHAGVLNVTVIAPVAPQEEQLNQISAKLSEAFDKKIQTSVEINPDLIGGFQIRIGDLIQDFSIKTQLERFKQKVMAI